MSTRVVERVDDWDAQSFADGYSGLHDLADRDFSGIVRAAGAELFMTKGVVVGIHRGTIEDFEGASGTAYRAPTPALPLLAIMQERSKEVRAQYYTEDTSIAEVDRTLEDGGFTGFVELSENVLSGDYYLVYHRGRSMSVAYVGNSKRLIEGDKAFDQANDEVGIYEVRPVDIDAIEIPEPAKPEEEEADAGAAVVDTEADSKPSEQADGESEHTDEAADESAATVADPDPRETTSEADTAVRDDPVGEAEPASTPIDHETTSASSATQEEPTHTDTVGAEPAAEPSEPAASEPPDTERNDEPTAVDSETRVEQSEPDPDSTPDQQEDRVATAETETHGDPRETATQQEPAPASAASQETQTRSQSERNTPTATESAMRERAVPESPSDLETKAIPSLDPELTETPDRERRSSTPRGDAPGRAGAKSQHQPEQSQPEPTAESLSEAEAETDTEFEPTEGTATDEQDEDTDDPDERVAKLQSALTEKRSTIQELESELQSAEDARDEARANLATVQEERDELQREVERLQSELSRLEEELGAKMGAERRITPQEALDGTDVFVRYHSKGEGTLEKAHDSGQRREDVTDNLRLEKHTQFDAATVSVGGQTYDEFIENRVEFKFVKWVVEDLLFEIQSTGHTETLKDLYDALPKINRIELNGVVTTSNEEEGETREAFDIVFRARMGDPLLVANLNESRQGATQSMMESLITAAERVGKATDAFASAFLVTESFFEPEALETVAGATRGGLLSRDKRKSFVNLSRKRGYHLCLVEARNENFHLEVPEL